MSGRRGTSETPLFSFETRTPSRRNCSNRSRGPTARELLDNIVASSETSGGTTRVTPPASNSASVAADSNFERSPHRESQWVKSDLLKWINGYLYRDTSITNAIKHLREHQKKLQASSTRIEEMLKQLTEAPKVNDTRTKHIPRALSVSTVLFVLTVQCCFVKRIVHDVYEGLVDEENEMRWNLKERYIGWFSSIVRIILIFVVLIMFQTIKLTQLWFAMCKVFWKRMNTIPLW